MSWDVRCEPLALANNGSVATQLRRTQTYAVRREGAQRSASLWAADRKFSRHCLPLSVAFFLSLSPSLFIFRSMLRQESSLCRDMLDLTEGDDQTTAAVPFVMDELLSVSSLLEDWEESGTEEQAPIKNDKAKRCWKQWEDFKLIELVEQLGRRWEQVAHAMEIEGVRGKHVRERYLEHLVKGIRKPAKYPWTIEELDAIERGVRELPRNNGRIPWSNIYKMNASLLDGRTCNAIKNAWNSFSNSRNVPLDDSSYLAQFSECSAPEKAARSDSAAQNLKSDYSKKRVRHKQKSASAACAKADKRRKTTEQCAPASPKTPDRSSRVAVSRIPELDGAGSVCASKNSTGPQGLRIRQVAKIQHPAVVCTVAYRAVFPSTWKQSLLKLNKWDQGGSTMHFDANRYTGLEALSFAV